MKNLKHVCLSLSFFVLGSVAAACPMNLMWRPVKATPEMSLCEVYDRYHQAVIDLHARGYQQARRISNLMAPRFINMPDWMGRRTDAADSALTLYSPAPTTWLDWERAAMIVDIRAQQNFKSGQFSKIDLNWIVSLHKSVLKGLLDTAGIFRKINNLGMQMTIRDSLTEKQVKGVQSVTYTQAAHPSLRLVRFVPVDCIENHSAEFQAAAWANIKSGAGVKVSAWKVIPADQFFIGADGQRRQCGYLSYAPHQEIPAQLDAYVKYVNDSTSFWGMAVLNNPIAVAARAQRWWITIHPFYDGNGRMSRFVMDLMLESLGLPAPLLKDMDDDMFSSESEWTAEVGRGLQRAVVAAEACVKNPKARGCSEIALQVRAR